VHPCQHFHKENQPRLSGDGVFLVIFRADTGKPYLLGEYSSFHLQEVRVILNSGTLLVGFNVIVMYGEIIDGRIDP
jgi:hypothetical protein